jgi:DNA-binding transcriptional MerR regulator
MTIKEIASVAGVSAETIRRTAKGLFPEKMVSGKKTDFNETDSIEIMKAVRKTNFVEPTQTVAQTVELSQELKIIYEQAKAINTLLARLPKQRKRVSKQIETKTQPALPFNETKTDRQKLNEIIREYSREHDGSKYGVSWSKFYNRAIWATGVTVRNLDEAEKDGLIPQLLELAEKEYKIK